VLADGLGRRFETTMTRHLAIVPAYNEAAAIQATIADLRAHTDFDVLVVDDGSTDETSGRARAVGAQVVRHPFNLGIGGAVQSGYQYAVEHGYEVAVQVDGDGQHDARCIPELLQALEASPDLNMVTGSRFLVSENGSYRSSRSRRLGIRLFGGILSMIVGQPVTDPTSGFRMVRGRGIELFARDYPHDYPEVEAVLLLHFHQLRSAEVPVRMRARTSGTSSINASRSAYYMIKVLLAIFIGLLRARPVVEAGDQAPVAAESGI
jgi:glycosyltransferase involved in cell wall biosynthesis